MTNATPIESMTKEQVNNAIDEVDRLIMAEPPYLTTSRHPDTRIRNEHYWTLRQHRGYLFDRLHALIQEEHRNTSIYTNFE